MALVNSCEKMYAISGGSRISRWGGRRPVGGVPTSQHVHFLAKTYVKTKEIDPGGGGALRHGAPLDPPMGGALRHGAPPGSANGNVFNQDT